MFRKWYIKKGGECSAVRGLRINREILILHKPPIEVVVLLTHVKNVKNVKHVKHVTFVVANGWQREILFFYLDEVCASFILLLVVQILHTD